MSHHKKVVSHNNNKHHKGQKKKKKPIGRHPSFNRHRKMKTSRHTSSHLHKKPAYTSSYDHTSISLISPSVTPQACCSFSPTYSSVPTATIDASDIFYIPSVTAVASQFDPSIGQNSLARADFPVTTTPIQMVILIVGLIGGTAFIAAAMFLVVRKRRTAFGDNKKSSSDEDEEQRMMAYLPELALTKQTNNEYQRMYDNNEPEKGNNNENKANNSSNSATELASAVNTLVASHDSNKKELENSTSQRSSWQTFITCETARTEDMIIDSINGTETRNRISIYRAKLAIPLITHT